MTSNVKLAKLAAHVADLTTRADGAEAIWRRNVAERDVGIRLLLAEGMTQRHVAEVTGLSPGRIGQIATRKYER